MGREIEKRVLVEIPTENTHICSSLVLFILDTWVPDTLKQSGGRKGMEEKVVINNHPWNISLYKEREKCQTSSV
jgi:hypothetical protein